MKGLVPARIPVHRTRKEKLRSHASELLGYTGKIPPVKNEAVRNMFQNPNLEAFYMQEVDI